MTLRAMVHSDPARGRVRVMLRDDETRMVFGKDQVYQPGDLPSSSEPPADVWVVDLPYQFADLVALALTEHFEGQKAPGDAYALRRDLEHEKGRTDKLLDFALEVARQPPMRVVDLSPAAHMTGE